ncbi:DMT family transporter [Azospirillum sp. Vi22]|uniref:DMT family transporter n=1 Tax=Azospirillum baldaniorum TaxID=1064539 RepID=UPI00157B5460|nr:DMT family transporter [Azospirillum baldaniorum]NUB04881.1 DMT family transporter [Azospirillum baldaniorum]
MSKGVVYLELTCSALFWGLTFNVAKIAVDYIPAMTTAGLRFLVAASLMLVLMLTIERGWVARLKRNWLGYLAMAVVGVVGFNAFFFFGMEHTSPTNGALIMATNPLVTALIAGLFLGEPISSNHKIGTLISFTGVAALILVDSGDRLASVNIGDLLVIGGNVSMALYSILGKRLVKDSTPLMTTAASTIFGAAILWSVARTTEPSVQIVDLPWQAYASILFMGVFGSVLAYIFWNRGIRAIGVADTAIFFHLVPVFTVLLSFVLGQTVTIAQIGAGIVVIIGVMISSGAMRKLLSVLNPAPETPIAKSEQL